MAEREGLTRAVHGAHPSGALKRVKIGNPADFSNPMSFFCPGVRSTFGIFPRAARGCPWEYGGGYSPELIRLRFKFPDHLGKYREISSLSAFRTDPVPRPSGISWPMGLL